MPRIINKPSLPGPDDIYRTVLPNGIIVLVRSNFNSPSVSMGGFLSAGAIFESDEKLGLADFVASSLMRGTQTNSFDEIYNKLETVGASMGFDSGVHKTSFGGRSLVEDLPLLLKLLSESLRRPIFPKAEIERLRTQYLTGLALRAQDTSDMADMLFDEMLFDGHPYARPTDGFPETIQSITRRDLQTFHRLYFGPKDLVIAIVGAVQPKKAVAEVEKALGGWRVPSQVDEPVMSQPKPLKKLKKRHHKIPGKSQSDLIIGMFAPSRKAPEYYATLLANSILGQFGMMGRIGDVVREKAGLAYYASSSLYTGLGPGSWEISAGVNPANLKKAISLIDKELRRFVKHGVTKEELAETKANFVGSLPLRLESNGGVVGAMLNMERYGYGLDYYQQYAARVNKVTRDDVLETVRKYIDPDKLVIATAGP